MFDNDTSPKFISANLDISPATIYRYVVEYQAGGIESWLESGNNGYWSMLSSHKTSVLRKELKKHVYMDAKSVSKWIRKTFGMPYTQGTIDLLNRIGFTYKKATEVPCEADASLQETFVAELTETLTQMEEGSVVYYADGVHPTHNSRSTYAWIEKGKQLEQPTVSGRDRINMNGLLNAHNVTDVIAHDCESVNAKSTRKLYESALAKHPDAPCIYIISDNAKYYHNKELKELGRRDKDKTNIPAAVFTKPEPDGTVVEVPMEESHKHRILSNKRKVQKSCQTILRKYRRF